VAPSPNETEEKRDGLMGTLTEKGRRGVKVQVRWRGKTRRMWKGWGKGGGGAEDEGEGRVDEGLEGREETAPPPP